MYKWFAIYLVRPYISLELPGWGRVYQAFVGSYENNRAWASAGPRVIRDKLYGYYRIVDLREWADRALFFLRRWYDLETALLVRDVIGTGQHVVDVGANYGHFSMAAAAAVGMQGKITSFEPNPLSYARLQTHIGLNRLANVQPFQMGLSDKPTCLQLNVPRINSGEASFGRAGYDDSFQVDCRVETLDDIVGSETVDFVKIDVEGFECNVLKGAKRVIRESRPLVLTEVVDDHLERASSSRGEMMNLMKLMDYAPLSVALVRDRFRHKIKLTPMSDKQFLEHPSGRNVLWAPAEKDVFRPSV